MLNFGTFNLNFYLIFLLVSTQPKKTGKKKLPFRDGSSFIYNLLIIIEIFTLSLQIYLHI